VGHWITQCSDSYRSIACDKVSFCYRMTRMTRVTRLGEFSPIRRLFSLASLLKIKEVAQILGPRFSAVPVMFQIWQKFDWATFWATFSQYHLVTLPVTQLTVVSLSVENAFLSAILVADQPTIHFKSLAWKIKRLQLKRSTKLKYPVPRRRGIVVIAFACRTEDPGSNLAGVKGF
jgi:hypothetical protein